jgi:hypothetical protein
MSKGRTEREQEKARRQRRIKKASKRGKEK